MSHFQTIDRLLQETSALLNLAAIEASEDPPAWTLYWENDTVVALELDDKDERLTMTTEIGPLPKGRELEFSRLLLEYSGLWLSTGGIRMGLLEGMVVQMHDLFPSRLEATYLCNIIENFVTKANTWIHLFSEAREERESDTLQAEDFQLSPLMEAGIKI